MGTLEDEPPTPLWQCRTHLLPVFHISPVWVSPKARAADMVQVKITWMG